MTVSGSVKIQENTNFQGNPVNVRLTGGEVICGQDLLSDARIGISSNTPTETQGVQITGTGFEEGGGTSKVRAEHGAVKEKAE